MHSRTKLSFILAGLFSSQAFAATFYAPDYFKFMYVDREKPALINETNHIELSAGQHELVIRYHQDMERFKEEIHFKSEPIIIDVNVGAEDDLKLQAVQPEKYSQAKAYAKNPEFNIVKQGKGAVSYQRQLLPPKSGFQLGRDYLKEIALFKDQQSNTNKLASLETQLAEAKQTLKSDHFTTPELEMLKKWYSKADHQSQIAYRFWIIDPTFISQQESKELKMLKQLHLKASATTQREIQIWLID